MRLVTILAVASAVAVAPAYAATSSPLRYLVRLKVSEDTRLVDAQTIELDGGSIASIGNGLKHYNIALTAVPSWQSPAQRIALSASVLVESGDLTAPKQRRSAVTVDVQPGKSVHMVVPADAESDAKPLEVELTVEPKP